MPAFVGSRMLGKSDKFHAKDSSVGFVDLFLEKMYLEAANAYRPISLEVSYLRGKKARSILVLESAIPDKMEISKAKSYFIDAESGTPKLIHLETISVIPPFEKQAGAVAAGGQFWEETGLSLSGPTGVVSGQRILLNGPVSRAKIIVIANPSPLRHPIFRVRRGGDATQTDTIGTGDGTSRDFLFTLTRVPVVPKSIKITFTDSVGVKTAMIRDSGEGYLVSTPTEFLLELTHGVRSMVNYDTGDIEVHFNPAHIPAIGTNIDAVYEYQTDGVKDETEYIVDWNIEEV